MGNREALLEGAKRCLLEKGYARTTARDIAEAAGVSLAAIGYHYGSKESLLEQAFMAAMEDWFSDENLGMEEAGGKGEDAARERWHGSGADSADAAGTQGLAGLADPVDAAGLRGTAGQADAASLQGSVGLAVAAGAADAEDSQGPAGKAGPRGSAGPAGTVDAEDAAGPQVSAEQAGSAHAVGPQGSAGQAVRAGAASSADAAGLRGSAGQAAAAGAAGSANAAGPQDSVPADPADAAQGRPGGSLEEFRAFFGRVMAGFPEQRPLMRLNLEMGIEGMHSPELGAFMSSAVQLGREGLAQQLAGLTPERDGELAQQVGSLYSVLMTGIITQYLIDRERFPSATDLAEGLRYVAERALNA